MIYKKKVESGEEKWGGGLCIRVYVKFRETKKKRDLKKIKENKKQKTKKNFFLKTYQEKLCVYNCFVCMRVNVSVYMCMYAYVCVNM